MAVSRLRSTVTAVAPVIPKWPTIRDHAVVNCEVVLLITMLLLSCCLLSSPLFLLLSGPVPQLALLQSLPHSLHAERIVKQSKSSLASLYLPSLICGTSLPILIAVLIHRTLKNGVSIKLGLVASICMLIMGMLFLLWSVYLSLDLQYYPSRSLGRVSPRVDAYIYVLQYAHNHPEKKVNSQPMEDYMHAINAQLECCGVYSLDDYFRGASIETASLANDNRPLAHRLSTELLDNCIITDVKMETTTVSNNETFNLSDTVVPARRQCTVPQYCCRHPKRVNCNVGSIDENGSIVGHNISSVLSPPCALSISHRLRDQLLCVSLFSALLTLTSIGHIVQLFRWARWQAKQKRNYYMKRMGTGKPVKQVTKLTALVFHYVINICMCGIIHLM